MRPIEGMTRGAVPRDRYPSGLDPRTQKLTWPLPQGVRPSLGGALGTAKGCDGNRDHPGDSQSIGAKT